MSYHMYTRFTMPFSRRRDKLMKYTRGRWLYRHVAQQSYMRVAVDERAGSLMNLAHQRSVDLAAVLDGTSVAVTFDAKFSQLRPMHLGVVVRKLLSTLEKRDFLKTFFTVQHTDMMANHMLYKSITDKVVDMQFVFMKEIVEKTLLDYQAFERKHLETVLVASAEILSALSGTALVNWIAERGPGSMPWKNGKGDLEKMVKAVHLRSTEQDFYNDFKRSLESDYAKTDYDYTSLMLSMDSLTEWRVERRLLGPEFKDAVAYCSFESREIVYNEAHLREHIYHSLFHIQTSFHEVAHALTYGDEHGECWANLARTLGDKTARAEI